MGISARQVEKIVQLAAKHREKAPELLDLLSAVVTAGEEKTPVRRNQEYVMKAVLKHIDELTYIQDKPPEEK